MRTYGLKSGCPSTHFAIEGNRRPRVRGVSYVLGNVNQPLSFGHVS